MRKAGMCLATSGLAAVLLWPVVAEAQSTEFSFHQIKSYDDVLNGMERIRADVQSGKIDVIEWVALRNAAYLLGEIRTTIGVTASDLGRSFESTLFGLLHDSLGSARAHQQYLGAAHAGVQPIMSEQSTSVLLGHWRRNETAFNAMMQEAGIVAELDRARMLASVIYAANIMAMKNSETSVDAVLAYGPGWLFPFGPALGAP